MSKMNEIASKSLGSANSYAVVTDKFDASLLNPMPRSEARKDWGITGDEFIGRDVWHCHEATFLLNSGAPVAGTIKFAYDARSEFMVESKSAKLYMNSFDMCKMGNTVDEAIANYVAQISHDLSTVLQTEVEVNFFESGSDINGSSIGQYSDLHYVLRNELHNITITDYTLETPHIRFIKSDDATVISNYSTNVLRSNCRHTKQKDTGTAYITVITSGAYIDPMSLYEHIVSLRSVNEFHEFCAEKLYVELASYPEVVSCCVTLLYSRRGSLDINPTRSSDRSLLPVNLINVSTYTKKTMGQ
jgi:7-cyano-7-deazaguanine reductase